MSVLRAAWGMLETELQIPTWKTITDRIKSYEFFRFCYILHLKRYKKDDQFQGRNFKVKITKDAVELIEVPS